MRIANRKLKIENHQFWMELIIESNLIKKDLVTDLMQEGKEITAIMASSKISARKNANRKSQIEN